MPKALTHGRPLVHKAWASNGINLGVSAGRRSWHRTMEMYRDIRLDWSAEIKSLRQTPISLR
eukprot:1160669-Pelagomonas_calceolata.AAC.2